MRLNKLVAILALTLMVTPILASVGYTNNAPQQTLETNNYGDTVLVQAGTTIKYAINTLTLPDMPNLTITGLSGNQLYVKVLAVKDDFEFNPDPLVTGTMIWYGLGLILTDDVIVSIGEEGFGATLDLILPAGAATPAIVQQGIPHFNVSYYSPTLFFLDNNWAEHELFLDSALIPATNNADTLTAEFINGTSGSASFTWRKSDGILTDLHIENVVLLGMDMRGVTLDISLLSTEVKGIDVTIGQEIDLKAEISYVNIEGEGQYYSMIPQSNITSIENEVASLEGQIIQKYIINDIEGLFYTASVYSYDMETDSLILDGEYEFCGFLGELPTVDTPFDGLTDGYMSVYAPVISTDYDIYAGYMTLFDTIVNVYLESILAFITDMPIDFTPDNIDGTFGVEEKRGYFFLEESLDLEVTLDASSLFLDSGTTLPIYQTAVESSIIVHAIIGQEGWVAYSEEGILAGTRMTLNIAADFTVGYDSYTTAAGTISIVVDIKLENPDYNPPDPIGGLIPGYTWLISIPALLTVAAIAIIRRKK